MKIRSLYNIKLKSLIIIIIIFYFLFGFIIFFFQNDIIYKPDNTDFYNCKELKHIEKINFNGTRFYFYNNNKTEEIIIFYHGNAGSACDRATIAEIFKENNLSYILVEYTGYSNDNNTPSKELLYQDVRNINTFISKLNYTKIYLGAESIGSAFATYHSTLTSTEKIFLISPFDELKNIILDKFPYYPIEHLLKENYNNIEMLKNFNNIIIIFHGNKDNVISSEFSKNLYKSLNTTKKDYVLLKNRGHNNMYSNTLFREIILFLNN
jgi:hypothetical protein